jgi:hypothetical protein
VESPVAFHLFHLGAEQRVGRFTELGSDWNAAWNMVVAGYENSLEESVVENLLEVIRRCL